MAIFNIAKLFEFYLDKFYGIHIIQSTVNIMGMARGMMVLERGCFFVIFFNKGDSIPHSPHPIKLRPVCSIYIECIYIEREREGVS